MNVKKRIKRIEKMIKADREQFKQFLDIYIDNTYTKKVDQELDDILKRITEKGKRYKQDLNIGQG